MRNNYGDAAERRYDRDILEQIQLILKRGTCVDTDKFKNDLMIGEMSKRGKLALPAVGDL